jgi:hypothetical protein
MPVCPQCQQPVESVQSESSLEWSNVARLANVAEAGYLASSLQAEGIAARVVELPSYSAAGGAWTNGFVLQVDSQSREAAIEWLSREADEMASEEPWCGPRGESSLASSMAIRLAGLVALAGFAGYWAGTHSHDSPPTQQATRLASELRALSVPLVALDARGEVVERLSYSAQRDALVWEQNRNGEGRFERVRLYRLAELE